MRFASVTAFLLISLLAVAAWAAPWIVVDPQFQKTTVDVTSIDTAGIHPAAGAALLKWENVLQLDTSSSAPATPGDYTLYMTDGDRLTGLPVSLGNDSIKWHSAVLGDIDIAVGRLLGFGKGNAIPDTLEESRKEDAVKFANGDSAAGLITSLTPDGIALQSASGTPTLPLANIAAVLFASSPNAPHPQRLFRLRLPNNESITVTSITLDANTAAISIDGKTTLNAPAGSICGIEQLNGPVTWLTSLHPIENIYRPFFKENFPARFDRTVAEGKPIHEKYPAFHHGIGCHSYSRLTYELDGSQQAFRSQFAVDTDSQLANVNVRIYLDYVDEKSTPAFEEKGIQAGAIHSAVTVPLKGAKTISLEVDYGKNFATEGRFIWLDPALLKSLPGAETPTTQP